MAMLAGLYNMGVSLVPEAADQASSTGAVEVVVVVVVAKAVVALRMSMAEAEDITIA
jgi:hypothetical protein